MDSNYLDVSSRVLKHAHIRQAISEAVDGELKEIKEACSDLDEAEAQRELERKHKMRALGILQRMRTCVSTSLLRIACWILNKILSRMFTNVFYHKGQIETIRKATEYGLPMIYLPVHRSHLDYVLISYILFMNNIKPPLVAAGDNLMLPFFGNLLRGLGAFFIKRKMEPATCRKDHVYRAVLQVYMAENLRQGHSLEFFLEGGRSRTGKALSPKAGLLSVVVDSVMENIIEDAFIVPIAISYEKLIDGNFTMEQMGQPKTPETFSIAMKAIWKKLHSNFGSVRVDFGQPFQLKEYLRSTRSPNAFLKSSEMALKYRSRLSCVACNNVGVLPRSTSLYGIDLVVPQEKRQTIYQLAEHVTYDSSTNTSLMSTQLLAFLLLNRYRKGASLPQLIQSMNWMRDELARRKRSVGFSGDSCDVVRYAFNVLGKDLVSTITLQMAWSSKDSQTGNNNLKILFIKPAIKLPHVIELHYYSNACISAFLMDSVVANAIFSVPESDHYIINGPGKSHATFHRSEILTRSTELCSIFQHDFLFVPPCKNLNLAINETIDDMIMNGLLIRTSTKSKNVNSYLKSFRFEDDDDGYNEQYETEEDEMLKVHIEDDSCEALLFYRSVLSPYIECYWLVACSLIKLIRKQKEEKTFLNDIIGVAKEKVSKGLICYEESAEAETFRNAIKLFETWKIIESHQIESAKFLHLNQKFDNENAIKETILHFEKFKK